MAPFLQIPFLAQPSITIRSLPEFKESSFSVSKIAHDPRGIVTCDQVACFCLEKSGFSSLQSSIILGEKALFPFRRIRRRRWGFTYRRMCSAFTPNHPTAVGQHLLPLWSVTGRGGGTACLPTSRVHQNPQQFPSAEMGAVRKAWRLTANDKGLKVWQLLLNDILGKC